MKRSKSRFATVQELSVLKCTANASPKVINVGKSVVVLNASTLRKTKTKLRKQDKVF